MVLPRSEGCGQEHQGLHRVLEGRRGKTVDERDATYLSRAVELAARGIANTAPNPPVGAIVVRDGRTLGEGWHHRKGEPHAEAEALRAAREAGEDVRGATMYVTLEPHDHESTMPRCSVAVIEAGIARVVAGALDPNPLTHGNGIARMRAAGVAVDVVDDAASLALIERFAYTIGSQLPFVTLKMAMSLDGFIAPQPGAFRVTGEAARARVDDLRAEHDAVMVGAGTVRVDDPQLTVRPHRTRVKPYTRIVVSGATRLAPTLRIFADPPDAPPGSYRPTLVLVPEPAARAVDLPAALAAVRRDGITSVLCEGGPTLAAGLLAAGLVERIVWFVAPRFLCGADAVAVLSGADLRSVANGWSFDEVERVGTDLMITARPPHV